MTTTTKYTIGSIGAAVIFFGGVYFFLFMRPMPASLSSPDVVIPAFPEDLAVASTSDFAVIAGTTNTAAAPEGITTYTSTHYGFSLSYPKELTVKTFDEGEGASTVTFQDTKTVQGFQIFIVPYSGGQVSMERFHADEPSGTLVQPTNILVGGTKATMFSSTNAALGDTIEVWVIKNGYLFEITAPKSLIVWLAHIMQTWKFLE